ncbi:phosphate transporter [Mortierella sp. AD032]|nr:phosphate transporter [Mortierella sp. AD032]
MASNSSSFSTLVGQLFFGYLGNAYGRHKFYSVDLMIIIFGTLFCAFSGGGDSGSDVYGGGGGGGGGVAVIQYLTFWRFVLAFGIGGDYPISATVTSEEAAVTSRRRRGGGGGGGGGQLVAMLTSIQGLGNVLTSIVTLIVLIRFRALIVDGEDDDAENMDTVWRICIAVGCLPALSTILIRYTMPATVPAHVFRLYKDAQNRFDGDDVGVLPLNDLPENEQDMGDKAHTCLSSQKQSPLSLLPPPSSPSRTSQRLGHTRVFRDYCSRWENLKVLIVISATKQHSITTSG